MKAVITEIRGAKAAVLQDDGSIRLLENKNYKIGQVVELKTTKWYNKATKWVAAAAAVLMITSGAASYAYLNPVATVSLDVNPSLEFRVNTFDKVISVKAMNDDGEQILEELKLKGMEIDEAIDAAIDEMVEQAFIKKNEENAVSVTIQHKNEKKQNDLEVLLDGEIKAYMAEENIDAEVEVEGIGAERVALAAEFNDLEDNDYTLTPGKLNLLEKLNAAQSSEEKFENAAAVVDFIDGLLEDLNAVSEDDEEITFEDLTVKDIMKELKRARLGVEVLPEEQAKDKEDADGEDVVNTDKEDKGNGKPESAPGLEDKEDKSPNENAGENANGNNAGGKNGGN